MAIGQQRNQADGAASKWLVVVACTGHFLAAIETVSGDVVTTMGFASGWIFRKRAALQVIVRTAHSSLRSRYSVLLYSHVSSQTRALARSFIINQFRASSSELMLNHLGPSFKLLVPQLITP